MTARSGAEDERPAGIRRSARFSPELEAMRGIAALLVVGFHADSMLRPVKHDPSAGLLAPLRAFVSEGQTGVTLFFVLSAFLLSQPFLVGARRGRAPNAWRFWERRALRILPLYFLAVGVATVMSAQAPADLLRGLPYLVFLNLHAPWVTSLFPYSPAWWSLATEVQFYLVLPLAGWLATSRPGRWALGALIAFSAAVFAAFAAERLAMASLAAHFSVLQSLVGRAPVFLCGVAAAWLWVWHGGRLREAAGRVRWLSLGGADAALLLLLLGLGFLLLRVHSMGYFIAESRWAVWHLYEGLLWTGVLLVVLLLPIRCRPLLSRGPLVGIGTLSYSLYLWHYPILFAFLVPLWLPTGGGPGWTARATAAASFGVAVALGVSALTYRFVERPFLVRKARIEG